jgi:tetratricopeptide (TPR) repeat protein
MSRRNTYHEETNILSATLALAAAVGAAVVCSLTLVGAMVPFEHSPAPFAWTDVALVQFLSSLPLAALIAALLRGRVGPGLCLALGGTCGLATAALWAIDSSRSAIALAAAVGAMLLVVALRRETSASSARSQNFVAVALLGLAVLIGLPRIYIDAHASHDNRNLTELLEQSRLGEARDLSQRLLMLDPARQFQGHRLADVATNLDRAVREIDSRVADPLPPDASDDAGLARARDLAMLGRTSEALAVLDRSASLAESVEAHSLRGTIHQTRNEWLLSAEAFRRAATALQSRPPSPEQNAGLIETTTGIAFAERKLGHNAAAEAAYQQVLKLDPSADSHFLLAQFYEGAQQAAKAQLHARRAMTLAPERYEQPGQRLIDQLVTHHFGCWGAAAAERHE